jgi:hypothetical protein
MFAEEEVFSEDDADRIRRNIVKTTRDTGRRHWSPVELNMEDGNGRRRRDVAWEYGFRTCLGAFYAPTVGRIAYDENTRAWTRNNGTLNVPIALFDKIKVVGSSVVTEHAAHIMSLTGMTGVVIRTNHGKQVEVFPQEVCKTDCKGTIARYKLNDVSNLNHAHYRAADEACSVNVNMAGGFHELAVNLRTLAAWYRSKNRHSRLLVRPSRSEENNNSITVDSIISAVGNEQTFKSKALNSSVLPLLVKSDFKTHKYIVPHTSSSPSTAGVTCTASSCRCGKCKLIHDVPPNHRRRRRTRPVTRHRDDHALKNTYRAKCLEPLWKKTEIQVHNRCLNCSAVTGVQLLPVICEIGAKLLQDTATARIDLALANAFVQLELQSNGLLPGPVIAFCEMICWRAKTRMMSRAKQMEFYRTKLEPILRQIQFTRQNYAQSGGTFCQFYVRNEKMLAKDDQSLVSHKYRNKSTIDIFRARMKRDQMKLTNKYPRRNRGPVYMSTCGPVRFVERMHVHKLDPPTESEL